MIAFEPQKKPCKNMIGDKITPKDEGKVGSHASYPTCPAMFSAGKLPPNYLMIQS